MFENKPLTPRWEKFAQALLATTCLGVAAGTASADTIIEGTSPAPADFPNTGPGFLLPAGTTVVQGQLNFNTDQNDWFEFWDLLAGAPFSVDSFYNPIHQERSMKFFVYDSSSTLLGSATLEGFGGTVTGNVPGDGLLVVEETYGTRLGPIGSPTYELDLTAPLASPEPSTGVGMALGLAGAWAWRRKRKAQA